MLSKTSCFKTLVKSDWRHYWPIAFGYAVLWLILQPVGLWQNTRWENDLPMALRIESFMAGKGSILWMCAIFAMITAMAVWSYLMKSSSVQFMHALPATRRAQFAAHYTAALTMLTAVHILTFLAIIGIMAIRGAVVWGAAFLWLLVAELTMVFFFALATLCCMITGWLLAAPVFYGGLNCVFVVVASLVQELTAQCNYWGYARGELPRFIYWLTPALRMGQTYNAEYQYVDIYETAVFRANPDALRTAAIYFAVGLVLAVCAYLFYEKRPSETAGDAVSFRWLRPIVKWVIAVCGGMVMGLFLVSLFLGERNIVMATAAMCIFGVLCYIAVEMLLRKSYRVFRWPLLTGCGILCAVFVVLSVMLHADVFGYEKAIPVLNDVESVDVSGSGASYSAQFSDSADIQKVLTLHEELIGASDEVKMEDIDTASAERKTSYLEINYVLENGTTLQRSYYFAIPEGSNLHHMLNDFYNDPAVRHQTIFPQYEEGGEANVTGGMVNLYDCTDDEKLEYGVSRQFELTRDQAREIYTTLGRETCEKGNRDILTGGGLQCEFNFENYADQGYFLYASVNLDCCPKTLKLLENYGMINGKG